jgi:hypothetical protein
VIANDFLIFAKSIFPEVQIFSDSVSFGEKLKVYFLPIHLLSQFEKDKSKNEIVLWEDIWLNRRKQVKARILSLLGHNKTIFARETQIVKIDKPTLETFLDENHIMEAASGKHKYGLMYKGILVAVACFSSPKTFYRAEGKFRSVELVRYTSLQGVNVVGAMGKLLEYFIEKHKPDDIMTYTDREWSDGEVYEKLGFVKTEQTAPITFWIHPQEMIRYALHRIPVELQIECQNLGMQLNLFLRKKGFVQIQNLGNNKFILKLKNSARSNSF